MLLDKVLKGVGAKRRLGRHPTHFTRTWPTHEYIIRNEPRIKSLVETLGDSQALSALAWLDLEKLGKTIDTWMHEPNIQHHKTAGDFFWSLLTLDRFLALTPTRDNT